MKKNSSKAKNNVHKTKQNLKTGSVGTDIVSLILRDHRPIKDLVLLLKSPKAQFDKKQGFG